MKQYNVAILGATGAVGREMLKILEERNFPVAKLVPLASARSAGGTVPFRGEEIVVQEATAEAFQGMDIVLGAVGSKFARAFAPDIVKAGAVFRMDPTVPLVVPEINPEDAFKHNGIIANPNCSTIITAVAVNALNSISPIESMVACTYQAVSGAGQPGVVELQEQLDALAAGKPVEPKVFPCQIACNVVPNIGARVDNDYTDEEMKLQNEGRKIMHLPELKVSCTCVRVPVMRSHSISVVVRTAQPISVADAEAVIAKAPGCKLIKDLNGRDYPTPLDTTDQDLVYVGRIRKDLICDKGLNIWCCGDQVRKGAATNAVQIALLLAEKGE